MKTKVNKKTLFIVLAVVLIFSIGALGTVAYLQASVNGSKALVNTFIAAGGGQLVDPTDPAAGTNADPSVSSIITAGFYLLESKAEYVNGNYTLSNTPNTRILQNTYDKVVPGLEIPKDPKLTLNIVEDVSVYVFIKITDTTSNNFTYSITGDWTEISVSGLGAGEKVYCYKNAVQTGAANDDLVDVGILTDNKITAASTFNDTDTGSDGIQLGQLKFEAYVCQAGGFENAQSAFTACFID